MRESRLSSSAENGRVVRAHSAPPGLRWGNGARTATFVAITTVSRVPASFTHLPSISSDRPWVSARCGTGYISAESKKFTPASTAREIARGQLPARLLASVSGCGRSGCNKQQRKQVQRAKELTPEQTEGAPAMLICAAASSYVFLSPVERLEENHMIQQSHGGGCRCTQCDTSRPRHNLPKHATNSASLIQWQTAQEAQFATRGTPHQKSLSQAQNATPRGHFSRVAKSEEQQ